MIDSIGLGYRQVLTQPGRCDCFHLRKGALLRWLMTRQITGEYADIFKDLCNSSSKDKLHDEIGDTRLHRDIKDVKDILH